MVSNTQAIKFNIYIFKLWKLHTLKLLKVLLTFVTTRKSPLQTHSCEVGVLIREQVMLVCGP